MLRVVLRGTVLLLLLAVAGASALYDPGWEERSGGVTVDSIMLVDTGERLNAETFQYWRERDATIVTFFIPKDEMLMALKHPWVMVTSDGVIIDRATYLEPDQYSEGVRYVLVNGTLVLDDGTFVEGARPGQAIRH